MSVVQKLSDLWDSLEEWFEKIGQDVVDFIKPLAKQIAENGGKLLLNAALEAVQAAEASGGSGRDKFDAAQIAVVKKLQDEGMPIVLNAINGAIESAVAALKSK